MDDCTIDPSISLSHPALLALAAPEVFWIWYDSGRKLGQTYVLIHPRFGIPFLLIRQCECISQF